MSIMRRLSLLAIGALLVMAVAASAASATTIHTVSTTGPLYSGSVSGSLASGTTADFVSGFVNVSCDTSSVAGTTNSSGIGSLSSASWTDSGAGSACPNNLGGSTTSTANNLPWGVTIADNSGSPTMTLSGVKATIVTPTFFGTVTCHYKGGGSGDSVTGSLDNSTGQATFNAVSLALDTSVSNSGSCSSTATWTGLYDISGSGGVRLYVAA
jgi:hypothetical protein